MNKPDREERIASGANPTAAAAGNPSDAAKVNAAGSHASASAEPEISRAVRRNPVDDPHSPALRAGVDFRGRPNSTEKVTEHLRPGRTRAPLLRYIRIDLPRTTRAVLALVVTCIGVSAVTLALSGWQVFPAAGVLQLVLAAASAVFVVLAAVTKLRVWLFGLVIAAAELLIYFVGVFGHAPFVWNGASLIMAAIWNIGMMAAFGYLVLFWALKYGMIAAYPDRQGFLD